MKVDQTKALNVSDILFRALCVMSGLFPQLSQSRRQRVVSVLIWLSTLVLWIFWIYDFLCREIALGYEDPNMFQMISIPNWVIYSIVGLSWRLLFMLKSKDFESVLQKRNRRLRDVVLPVLSVSPLQVLHVYKFFTITDKSARFGELCFLSFDFIVLGFFLAYEDATTHILKIHTQLNVSTKTTTALTATEILAEKGRIRKMTRKINKLFALPLAMYYSNIVIVVLYTLSQSLGNRSAAHETVILIVCQFCYLLQLSLLAKKGSTLATKCLKLESIVLMRIPDNDSPSSSHLLRAVRFREEWDVLKVGCFALGTPNLLRFLASCVTFIAVVLQFDYRVVRAMNRLGSSQ